MSETLRIAPLGIVLTATLLFSGCSTPAEMQADYPSFNGVSEIAATGDVVVRGEFIDSHEDILYPTIDDGGNEIDNPQAGLSAEEIERARKEGAVPVTISSVRVLSVLKGDAKPGEVIEVSQLGGSIDGEKISERETQLLGSIKADSLVLVLASHCDAPYDLLHPTEAVYAVDSSGKVSALSSEEGFAVSTLDDLEKAVDRAG